MQKLILLSKYFTAAAAENLGRMCQKPNSAIKIAFCSNAGDLEDNREYIDQSKQELKDLGYKVQEFDLNLFCNRCSELTYLLSKFDATFFTGGDSNYLIYLFHKTGLTEEYCKLIQSGQLIHMGFSAGAIICAPHMKYAQIMDSTLHAPELIDSGLNLTNIHIVPHYADKPKYTKIYEDIIKKHLIQGDIVIPLTNQQGIVVEGLDWQIIS